MDFSQMLVAIMDFIDVTLYTPVYNFIDVNIDHFSLDSTFNLSGLFGITDIPIFSISDLITTIIAFSVAITALMLFIKFMKWLVGFIGSLFSGVKK